MRKELGLYTNIRPVKVFPTLIDNSPLKKEIITGTDFIIYRALTGGIYFGEKKTNAEGTLASDLCEYSEKEISRIGHLAFKAAKNRRNKLTLVDKANVLESSRLWRKVVTSIGESYPEVSLDFLFVDNAAMQIILNPSQFDVILTENMFGDILSDLGAGLMGGLGLAPSADIGLDRAVFQPCRGSAPDIAGQGLANPFAMVLSAAMMLDWLGARHDNGEIQSDAKALRAAVDAVITEGRGVTRDLGGSASTDDAVHAVADQMFLYA